MDGLIVDSMCPWGPEPNPALSITLKRFYK